MGAYGLDPLDLQRALSSYGKSHMRKHGPTRTHNLDLETLPLWVLLFVWHGPHGPSRGHMT